MAVRVSINGLVSGTGVSSAFAKHTEYLQDIPNLLPGNGTIEGDGRHRPEVETLLFGRLAELARGPIAETVEVRKCAPSVVEARVQGTGVHDFPHVLESRRLEPGEKAGFSYQYLDGQTTPVQRQERVEAFQRGESDAFLISLKAGGTGLNLTAADQSDWLVNLSPLGEGSPFYMAMSQLRVAWGAPAPHANTL